MRPHLILIACAALSGAAGCFEPSTGPADDAGGAGGADAGGAGTGGATDDACSVDADCGWGEIDHEILQPGDCTCLFGCPSIPLNVETIERRLAQHAMLCNSQFDGMGHPCPIDDCAMPLPAMCVAGSCTGDPFGRQ